MKKDLQLTVRGGKVDGVGGSLEELLELREHRLWDCHGSWLYSLCRDSLDTTLRKGIPQFPILLLQL